MLNKPGPAPSRNEELPMAHADYPHYPGTLHDCPECERNCYCTDGTPCVHCEIENEIRAEGLS